MASAAPAAPNILIIVADDLGFSDLGCYGSEIHTPHLDSLAAAPTGVRLTDFHTASACSPTRSMLLTGVDHHLTGLGQMAETIGRKPEFQGQPGYEGVLNEQVVTLPEILRDSHTSFIAGKWHLGLTEESSPQARGFDKSWVLLPGAGNHYAWRPPHVEGQDAVFPATFREGRRLLAHDELPAPFYSSDVFTDRWLAFHTEARAERPHRPWLGLLTFTAPHWPLQAPRDVCEKYRGVYADGPDALRQRRLAGLLKAGLISEDAAGATAPARERYCGRDTSWSAMSAQKQAESQRAMEVYAAMVELMDANVGRVLQRLRETGELDNTFILFMSDNGAEGALLEALPLFGEDTQKRIQATHNNSLDNIGRQDSFVWYGPMWAQSSTAPSSMYKAWITEGGIRCPAIVHLPPRLNDGAPMYREHRSGAFTTVMDVLPTALDLAGVRHPAPTWNGRAVHAPRGRTWLPWLRGRAAQVHADDDAGTFHGWELFGQQAVRQGSFKALFIPPPEGPGRWQLFDLAHDAAEACDLAAEQPERLARLLQAWAAYELEAGVVTIDAAKWQVGYGAH